VSFGQVILFHHIEILVISSGHLYHESYIFEQEGQLLPKNSVMKIFHIWLNTG